MAAGQKLVPLQGMQLDAANQFMTPLQARYIKNLVYELSDLSEAGSAPGAQSGVMKPLESNALYCIIDLPAGDNYVNGVFPSRNTNELYVWVWNSNADHSIFRINGLTQSADVLYVGSCIGLINVPEYFIHEGGCYLEVFTVVDPDTEATLIKKDLYWTNGKGYQGYLRTDDSLQTHYFDSALYPYFLGDYNKCLFVRMGIPTPIDCIDITEIPVTDVDAGLDNNRLFNTWQFRVRDTDVWGRPSEWGEISEMDIPGINDCLGTSSGIPRCVTLTFEAGNPSINTKEIAYRNCNDEQWYLDNTLFLYKGSNLGKWWLRERNPDVMYDPTNNKISYVFCRNKECTPIPTTETDRLENPLPKSSQALYKQNKDIGLANNEDGFNPFSIDLKKKFSFDITTPPSSTLDVRTITIYAAIYNQSEQLYGQVIRDNNDGYLFGCPERALIATIRAFDQVFANTEQSGFIGYLVGSGYAISTQVYLDASGQLVDDPTFQGTVLSPTGFTLQKWVFNNVPKGSYVFRLASHLTNPLTTSNYQDTSTTVWGLCPYTGLLSSPNINVLDRGNTQELIVNACAGDYNTLTDNKVLVIADLAKAGWKATSGYIYETANNGFNQFPMELMDISSGNGFTSIITDPNGFYYYATQGIGRTFVFSFYYKCVLHNFTQAEHGVGMEVFNVLMDTVDTNAYPDFSTVACNRVLVKGRALLAGTNIGVANSVVVLTRGRTAVTDNDGNFTIIAHDYAYSGVRNDSVLFTNGACVYTLADGSCIVPIDIQILKCSICQERILNLPATLELIYPQLKGLLSGGVYGVAGMVGDWLDRKGYWQDLGYLNIPSIIQSQSIGPSRITANIAAGAIFDQEVESIVFGITQETTIADYLSWIVDRVEFIDNTGLVNLQAPTQIRIYYASVAEYSKQNNFSTTTGWQFLETTTNKPVTGDKVLFYVNGDGKFFSKSIIGLVRYDLDGTYFLIDYNSDLADLKQNALIRLVRTKLCTGNEPYFVIPCSKIDVKNGVAQQNSIILNAFDTYYLSRQIPVPTPINATPTTTTVTTTTTVGETTTAVQSVTDSATTVNELRNFGFRFEHDSPSNFWGKGCWNAGRVNVKNPYETKLKHPTQIKLSGALSITGQLSFLQYFDDELSVDFDVVDQIVYVRPRVGMILVILQYSNFIVGVGDNLARMTGDGNLQVPSGPNTFGKPERNSIGVYGCQLFDKNTIRERQGRCMFLDRSRGEIVFHDFSVGVSVSSTVDNPKRESTIMSWLLPVIKYNQQYNIDHPDNTWYFTAVINPANSEWILSSFKVGGTDYVNQERGIDITKQETIGYDMKGGQMNGVWKSFYSSTPEGWGYLEGATLGKLLFAFKNGKPYSYSSVNKTGQTYNTFFGEICDRVYRFVAKIDMFAKEKWLFMAVYCPQSQYFADEIFTETNQQSRLLLSAWKEGMYMWSAPFLCDLNTPFDPNRPEQTGDNKLMDGNNLLGSWIDVRLIGEASMNDKYSELTGVTVNEFLNQISG